MANTVLMPQKGISEESAVLSEWKVKVGDKVKTGDIIFNIETGKASYDVESEFDGYVLALLCAAGDELAIQAPVCVIGAEGEKADAVPTAAAAPAVAPADKPAEAARIEATPAAETAPAKAISADGFVAASPRAKALAEKAGVDIAKAAASGPEGRIIERDVNEYLNSGRTAAEKQTVPVPAAPKAEQAAPAAPAAAYTDKPISKVRKVIAENMYKSLQGMAQLTLNSSFDASTIMAYRKTAKAFPASGLDGVTLGDMVLYAVSRTLPEFPDLNAHMLDNTIRYFAGVNLAFACDTPRGLLVPVILGADKMSLLEISKAVKELAAEAQSGSVAAEKLSGGSFTVSNLGPFGVESFTPVINPPQTGILGVNTITTRVKEVNGELKAYPAMALSLTFDHRAVDGAPAAKFLKALCANLESFTLLLAK